MQNYPFQTNGYCILDYIQIIVINNLYCIDFFRKCLQMFFYASLKKKKDEQKRVTKIKNTHISKSQL